MSEGKKICPFIFMLYFRLILPVSGSGKNIECIEDKCMAWGEVGRNRPTYEDIKEKGDYKVSIVFGCKLIEKAI